MNRDDLISETRKVLSKCNFLTSDPTHMRSISFDVVARREKTILFIKVLQNIDAFTKGNSDELKTLANVLGGSPMVIGTHSGSSKIENGVVYSRFGIPIVSLDTFKDYFLDDMPPLIFAAPGGFYVHIDGDKLRNVRADRNISLGTLAHEVGVSRRTIRMYEEGMGAVIDAALRLEEFLEEPIILPSNPLTYSKEVDEQKLIPDRMEKFGKDVFFRLSDLGYEVHRTYRCPFEALTEDKKNMFLTSIENQNNTMRIKRARVVTNVSKIVDKDAVIFVNKQIIKENIEGTPLITFGELSKINEPEKVLQLIEERKKR